MLFRRVDSRQEPVFPAIHQLLCLLTINSSIDLIHLRVTEREHVQFDIGNFPNDVVEFSDCIIVIIQRVAIIAPEIHDIIKIAELIGRDSGE